MEEKYKNIHAEYIERSLAGDSYAQSKLYHLYAKAMFNVCYRMVNNLNDAEDVLQEAFISAFSNLKSYKAQASFGAWLKRIVINKSINFLTKKKLELVIEEEIDIPEPDDDTSHEEDTKLGVLKIKEALMILPDGYRLVFSLYLIEGYDHKEIAQILGITESTSKSQFNRAKKKIKDILNKEVINE